jgi:hypothetical protein
MSIQYVAHSLTTSDPNNVTSLTHTHGLTIQEGDLILLAININQATEPTVTDNSGAFTNLPNFPAFNGTIVTDLWFRIAGASEASSWQFSHNGTADRMTIFTVQFRGVDQNAPFRVTPDANNCSFDETVSVFTTVNPSENCNSGDMAVNFAWLDNSAGLIQSVDNGHVFLDGGTDFSAIAASYKHEQDLVTGTTTFTGNSSSGRTGIQFVLQPAPVSEKLIPVKRTRTKQPPPGTPLDLSNPLLDRAVYGYNFADGASPQGDLIGGLVPENVDMTSGADSDLRYMATTGVTGDIWRTRFTKSFATSQPISGVILMRGLTTEAVHIIGQRDGTEAHWQFYNDGTAGLFFRVGNNQTSTANFFTTNDWMVFSFSFIRGTGSYCNVYNNGEFVADIAQVDTPGLAADMTLGHRWEVDPTTAFEGALDYAFVGLWDRKLSDGEHKRIASNVWQLFEPESILYPSESPTPNPLWVPFRGVRRHL